MACILEISLACILELWKNGGDIRYVVSIGKLVRQSDGPQEIELRLTRCFLMAASDMYLHFDSF